MLEFMAASPDEVRENFSSLCRLLIDCVAEGASIGFTDAADKDVMVRFWLDALESLDKGERQLWLAWQHGKLVGTVSLVFATMPNGRHRAEISKLMVHPLARRQGIARQLMQQAEAVAREKKLQLLVLDTRSGDAATALYLSLGWQIAGEIPDFAESTTGALEATTLMYKRF